MRAAFAFGLATLGVVAAVGVGCGAENALVDGECILPGCAYPDGSSGSSGSSGGRDGALDGPNGDGPVGDGKVDGPIGECTPPYVTSDNCGACGKSCESPKTDCIVGPDGTATCELPCTPPLIACLGKCIDVSSDPLNCGACGKVCPSNLCVMGKCQGATPGDIVVIGHDYRDAFAGSSQAKLLTNAVFIPTSNPLRVLSYEQFADGANVTQVKSLVSQAAAGRMVKYTVANAPGPLASATLADNFDVVLVYDQPSANAATLASNGTTWSTALNLFAKAGGVIVVLDGAGGQGAMPTLLTSAKLVDTASHAPIAKGTLVGITAPADRVATLVVGPYSTADRSVTFQPNEPNSGNLAYVAERIVGGVFGDPVVLHKSVP